jgi:hypothetical protein
VPERPFPRMHAIRVTLRLGRRGGNGPDRGPLWDLEEYLKPATLVAGSTRVVYACRLRVSFTRVVYACRLRLSFTPVVYACLR